MISKYVSEKYQNLSEIAEQNARNYISASPFPNIVFENFFNENYLNEVLNEFPDLSKGNAVRIDTFGQQKKIAATTEDRFGEKTVELMHFLNSEPFLKFLQVLTGIEEALIPDPYYFGGGLHETKQDGLLKVHIDFNKHKTMHLDRRLNILVYLNKNWEESYGGHFELWNKDMTKCEKRILPTFNTLAMFSTSYYSYHGHPDPLTCPPDRSRRSLALYYYSNGRPASEIVEGHETHGTVFQKRAGVQSDKVSFSTRAKKITNSFIPPIVSKGLDMMFRKK